MQRCHTVPQEIRNSHPITRDSDDRFLALLQQALLLALQEQGHLSITQYRHAEELLRRRHRTGPYPERRTP